MRYYQRLNGNRLPVPQTIIDIGYTSAILVETFIKIKALSEDLFCAGDIENVDYCMEVYIQFLNNEPLDFFMSGNWEIQLAFQKIKRELFRFSEGLVRLFILFCSLFPQNKISDQNRKFSNQKKKKKKFNQKIYFV